MAEIYCNIQGIFLVTRRIHGDLCAACREAHTNFAREWADNARNEGK
jgi:hypothetical protein